VRVVYLANVGTRDVQHGGKPLHKPRPEGEALVASYEAVRRDLSAPILAAGIRHVLQVSPTLGRMQLFVSDQPAPPRTPAGHWDRDTIFFGTLLQRLLRDQFGQAIEQIECEPMRFNPSDYNRTVPFFAENLPLLVPPDVADIVYVAPVGGTDASNVGLTINAVDCYRDRCQFIYVMPEGQVQLLNLHRELLDDYARREAAAHLERQDYAALRETLRRGQLGRPWHQHLCDYADRRMRFDFARADAALQEAITTADGGETKAHLARLRQWLRPFLAAQPQPASASTGAQWSSWFDLQRVFLGELFHNLRLKVQQGEWVDFLGRVFRLHEGILRLVFELETRHSTDGTDRKGYPDFEKAIREDSELSGLKIDARPTTFVLGRVLEHWVRTGGKATYGPVEGARGLIEELTALRNKSIIAHGYEAVSEEDIRRALKGRPVSFLLDKVREALERLGVNLAEEADPFAIVRRIAHTFITPR
jgi:hypothetical protein